MGPVYFWHGKQQIVSPRRMVPTDRFLWLVIIITSRLGQMQGTYKIIKCTSHIDINGTFGKVQRIFEQCQTQDCQGRLIIEYRVLTLDCIFLLYCSLKYVRTRKVPLSPWKRRERGEIKVCSTVNMCVHDNASVKCIGVPACVTTISYDLLPRICFIWTDLEAYSKIYSQTLMDGGAKPVMSLFWQDCPVWLWRSGRAPTLVIHYVIYCCCHSTIGGIDKPYHICMCMPEMGPRRRENMYIMIYFKCFHHFNYDIWRGMFLYFFI